MSTRLSRLRNGVPVYRYDPAPGVPPASVLRLGGDHHPADGRRHIHDFPLLLFTGAEAMVLAPGQVVDPDYAHIAGGSVAVIFDPAAFETQLLSPFREARRMSVPSARVPFWWSTIASIEAEADRSRVAVAAHATLLLVELGRLVPETVPDLAVEGVLDVIATRFADGLSLRDVAATVGLTPGYLTTFIRERTGRTVQQWITEYRMAAARRLLAEGSVPVAEVARRVGIADPAYFTRVFRRETGTSPTAWRSGARRESAV